MAKRVQFTQENGLPCEIDPDTVTCIKALEPNEEHKHRTVILHGAEGRLHTMVLHPFEHAQKLLGN